MNALAARARHPVAHTRCEKIVIVTRQTALEELIARFGTAGQVKFWLEHAGQDYAPIAAAHAQYHAILDGVRNRIPAGVKHQIIDRAFLPQFSFGKADLIVTVGPDGLVVNTAKYLDGQPIVAVNPDPAHIEGILLPFNGIDAVRAIDAAVRHEPRIKHVTMAETELNDSQRLFAFNDFFVGARSHVSARYRITSGERSEEQSSSGILISTGAGSTGWLKSVYAGAARVISALGGAVDPPPDGGRFPWEADKLIYVVREPWPSKTTGATLAYGVITKDQPLVVTSQMADNGVIFSDGVEADYLAFTAGLTATIRVADKKACLVVSRAKA